MILATWVTLLDATGPAPKRIKMIDAFWPLKTLLFFFFFFLLKGDSRM